MDTLTSRLADNLAHVRGRMAVAAARAGRNVADVALIGVTKYVGPQTARALIAAGCCDLGESRPQDLWAKAAAIGVSGARWHLIGHLQRNKVARTLPLATLIQSVDSQRLLAAIDREALALDRRVAVFLEVNISGDAAKHGFAPGEMAEVVARAAEYPHVEIRGLMGMASLEGGLAAAQRDFSSLRELRDRLAGQCPNGISLRELSMGMSGDFEVAIEEGATMVRVGSALFEGIA